jgi:signal transduction histidine kinase
MKGWKGRVSLRINTKFTLAILLVTLSFLCAIFLISRDMLNTFSLQTAEEVASVILEGTDARVKDFFDQMEALCRSLSYTQAVRAIDPKGMRDLFIASVLSRNRYLRAIYLGTEDGRMFEWGVGPEFIDYTPTFPPGYDPRKRPWYQTALEKNGFAVSEPYRYASVDAEGITCVLPVRDVEGRLLGVLGLDILLDNMQALLEDLNIPKGGKALLVSAKGRFIAGSLNPQKVPGLEGKFADAEGVFRVRIEGSEMLVSHRLSKPLGWHLLVALPYAQILFNARWLLTLITIVEVLLMGMLTIVISIITNRFITSPLHRIIEVVNRIEGGDRTARIKVMGEDEFGILGRELNKLVEAVDQYSSSLEQRVRERTEEVKALQQEITRFRILEERKRIYRDMHDSIGAKLTNIFFCANVARKMMEREGPLAGEKLEGLLDDVETNCLEAMKQVKSIVGGLDEGEGMEKDFGAFLSASIRKRLEMKGIEFACRIDPPNALSVGSSTAAGELEKVFEELVSNVLKHSGAKVVELEVTEREKSIQFRFSDNGTGIDGEDAPTQGKGLENIQFRIQSLGGRLSMETGKGEGTRFTFELPKNVLRLKEEIS